jgi:hypothetical protein
MKSLFNFNRETAPMVKVAFNVQILEENRSDDTYLIFGGFQRNPQKMGKTVIAAHFSSL